MKNLTFERSRVIGFSDAVFSVAMTLLILEVTVPTYQAMETMTVWDVLAKRIPNFIGFIVSFFVTAMYWTDYLKVTKFVKDFNSLALWTNIILLFFVVLLPFSTALYVNGILHVGPFVFYSINLTLIAVMIFILIQVVAKKEEGKTGLSGINKKWLSMKIMNTICVWTLAAVVAFIHLPTARYLWILIFIVDPIIDKVFSKKLKRLG